MSESMRWAGCKVSKAIQSRIEIDGESSNHRGNRNRGKWIGSDRTESGRMRIYLGYYTNDEGFTEKLTCVV